MKVEFSKKTKMILYPAIVVIAFSVGIFLEFYDDKEYIIEPVPQSTSNPEIVAEIESRYDDEGRLNLNTATKEELVKLNGIGEKLADRIISFRTENGNFEAVEELTMISGIGDSLIEKIRDDVCVK